MTSLISIGDLITNGLKDIQKTWKPTLKYTIWFLVAPILYMGYFWLTFLGMGSTGTPGPGSFVLMGIGYVAFIVGLLWASVALMQYLLEHARGKDMKKWQPKTSALSYVPGVLWISILTAVAVMAAWVIAFIPAMLAGDSNLAGVLMAVLLLAAIAFTIWFMVVFSQAMLLLLTDEARGIKAMKASFELVNGRWWKTLWRLFLPNLVFQIVVSIVISILYMVFFMIAFALFGGWMTSLGIGQEAGVEAMRASNVGFGIVGIVFGVIFFVALMIVLVAQIIVQAIYQGSVSARLFFSLKHTKIK